MAAAHTDRTWADSPVCADTRIRYHLGYGSDTDSERNNIVWKVGRIGDAELGAAAVIEKKDGGRERSEGGPQRAVKEADEGHRRGLGGEGELAAAVRRGGQKGRWEKTRRVLSDSLSRRCSSGKGSAPAAEL